MVIVDVSFGFWISCCLKDSAVLKNPGVLKNPDVLEAPGVLNNRDVGSMLEYIGLHTRKCYNKWN